MAKRKTCAFLLAVTVSSLSSSGIGATLTLNEAQKLLASDGESGDRFGQSVAVDGNTAVIGSRFDDDKGPDAGAAYVFVRATGVWTQQAKLVASDGTSFDQFGSSVALDGDTIVIGAYSDDSAYVFVRTAGGWTQQAKLLASAGSGGAGFGGSVALDRDTAVIGAAFDDPGAAFVYSGAAYVFTRTAGVWAQAARLKASDGASSDQFGFSVAVDGDTAVVGARRDDDRTGSAHVFMRSAGVWTEQAKLLASDGASTDEFGFSVAVDGDTAVIGAPFVGGGGPGTGSVYVFTHTAGGWTQDAKLLASGGAMSRQFGYSVALDDDIAVIGERLDSDYLAEAGSAYVFTRTAGVWTQQTRLLASDAAEGDQLGWSVALDGGTAVIGAGFDESAYVFSLVSDPATLLDQLRESVTGIGPGKSLANKVALAQAYYAVPDVRSTCAVLTAFLREVAAQAGKKKLSDAQATAVMTSALAIMSEIGCMG